VGVVAARVRAVRLEALEATTWTTPALLVALSVLSLWIRTRIINGGFWIDEGLSVGIAHHHFWSIPHLLRQDGSPPLYYLLLNVWMRWFGDGERATHALSLVSALACIPLAYWAATSLFGRVAGWVCAVLAAFDPYLTYYAQETRMYTLLAALSVVTAVAYVHGVLQGRRRWLPLLVASLVLTLYTHNWGLFVCVALAVATVAFARERWREALVAAAATALLYAPWLPTLLFQVRHTGAPWSTSPSFHQLVTAPGAVVSGDAPLTAFVLAGGAGLVTVVRRRGRERQAVLAFGVLIAVTIVLAWGLSQLTPAWASRYLAIVLGPILLVAAAGLARAGRLGLAALVAVIFLWTGVSQKDDKSNARAIAEGVAPYVHRGDLVLSTHPEQVPVLRYYLGAGLRWATELGPVRDAQVMDWRDALKRLKATTRRRDLDPVLASVRPGQRLIVFSPVFRDYRAWKARWTKEVYRRSVLWTDTIDRDPRFRATHVVRTNEILLKRNFFKPLQAVVYVRRR
jgi:hypothetical protein